MLTQEIVKISRRFIGRVKFTSQDLDHFSHTSGSVADVSIIQYNAQFKRCIYKELCCSVNRSDVSLTKNHIHYTN